MSAVLDYAEQHAPWFIEYTDRWRQGLQADRDSLHRHTTIGEVLRWYNQPQVLGRTQAMRMRTLEVGADSNHIGIEPVASVYERNFPSLPTLRGSRRPAIASL